MSVETEKTSTAPKTRRGGARRRPGSIEAALRAGKSFPPKMRVVVTVSNNPDYVGKSGVVHQFGRSSVMRVVRLDDERLVPFLISQLKAENN